MKVSILTSIEMARDRKSILNFTLFQRRLRKIKIRTKILWNLPIQSRTSVSQNFKLVSLVLPRNTIKKLSFLIITERCVKRDIKLLTHKGIGEIGVVV